MFLKVCVCVCRSVAAGDESGARSSSADVGPMPMSPGCFCSLHRAIFTQNP